MHSRFHSTAEECDCYRAVGQSMSAMSHVIGKLLDYVKVLMHRMIRLPRGGSHRSGHGRRVATDERLALSVA